MDPLQRTGKTLLHALVRTAAHHKYLKEKGVDVLDLIQWLVSERRMSLDAADTVSRGCPPTTPHGALGLGNRKPQQRRPLSAAVSRAPRVACNPGLFTRLCCVASAGAPSSRLTESRLVSPQEGRTPLHDFLSEIPLDDSPRVQSRRPVAGAESVPALLLEMGASPDTVATDGTTLIHALLDRARGFLGPDTLDCLDVLIEACLEKDNRKVLVQRRAKV